MENIVKDDEKVAKYVREVLCGKKKNYHNIYYNKLTNREIKIFKLTSYNMIQELC